MFILRSMIYVAGKFWSHDEGWCRAVVSAYTVKTGSLAFQRLGVAAGHAVFWCIVEFRPHRSRESAGLVATCLTLSHAVRSLCCRCLHLFFSATVVKIPTPFFQPYTTSFQRPGMYRGYMFDLIQITPLQMDLQYVSRDTTHEKQSWKVKTKKNHKIKRRYNITNKSTCFDIHPAKNTTRVLWNRTFADILQTFYRPDVIPVIQLSITATNGSKALSLTQ